MYVPCFSLFLLANSFDHTNQTVHPYRVKMCAPVGNSRIYMNRFIHVRKAHIRSTSFLRAILVHNPASSTSPFPIRIRLSLASSSHQLKISIVAVSTRRTPIAFNTGNFIFTICAFVDSRNFNCTSRSNFQVHIFLLKIHHGHRRLSHNLPSVL